MTTDAELLYAWRAGDTEAGQQLFKRYYGPVARFFANKIREAPGDLVQETFMGCVKGRDRIREGSNFRSYLFGVAYRVLTSYLRHRYEAPDDLASVSVLDLDPGPSTILHRSEEVRLLLQALRTLPLELQVVVELRYWEQMTSTDISHVLGIPAATVRGRLRTGRTRLEEVLRTLPASPDVVHSTVSDIDGWAQKVREGVQPPLSA
ncbi:MAG: sigma-70 family RNA polymerase sigma factor [Myxococcota bacterium]